MVAPGASGCEVKLRWLFKGQSWESGGGGLFRDSDGRVLVAFSCYFGEMTSLQAEVKALLHGVRLGVARGLANFHVESDSLVLIQMLQGRAKWPWVVQRELQELAGYSHLYTEISHCFLEANKPADRLAKLGADFGESVVYDSVLDLPRMARGDVTLDRWASPSFRRGRIKG
ncbi:uncharacterized protein [Coffea arabica]|uniref:RNase H type-1 domain-containing protein n=1 Tax=Coffea arabica TaxID=13443 RepID=A0A6P6SHY0_COFAR|nr:uncharacterized protein LOC113691464 [Coffea arabica]